MTLKSSFVEFAKITQNPYQYKMALTVPKPSIQPSDATQNENKRRNIRWRELYPRNDHVLHTNIATSVTAEVIPNGIGDSWYPTKIQNVDTRNCLYAVCVIRNGLSRVKERLT
jgi:hypothetical protein